MNINTCEVKVQLGNECFKEALVILDYACPVAQQQGDCRCFLKFGIGKAYRFVELNLGNWVSFLNDKVGLIRRSFFPLMGESWLGTNMVYVLYANMRKVANFQNVCFG